MERSRIDGRCMSDSSRSVKCFLQCSIFMRFRRGRTTSTGLPQFRVGWVSAHSHAPLAPAIDARNPTWRPERATLGYARWAAACSRSSACALTYGCGCSPMGPRHAALATAVRFKNRRSIDFSAAHELIDPHEPVGHENGIQYFRHPGEGRDPRQRRQDFGVQWQGDRERQQICCFWSLKNLSARRGSRPSPG